MNARQRSRVDRMARECVANRLRMLTRVVTGVYEEEFRPFDLKVSQMIILVLTARQGRIRAVDISRKLQMDASTVSRNLERMRGRGWLETVSGPGERSRPLRLTRRGEEVLRETSVAWERAQARAVSLVGEEGAALLRRLTDELAREGTT